MKQNKQMLVLLLLGLLKVFDAIDGRQDLQEVEKRQFRPSMVDIHVATHDIDEVFNILCEILFEPTQLTPLFPNLGEEGGAVIGFSTLTSPIWLDLCFILFLVKSP